MRLPVEIRLYVYELALKNNLTYIESFASCPTFVYEKKLKLRGALALLLASKAIRAEFSEGVMLQVTARCESFSARIKALELEWKMELEKLHRDLRPSLETTFSALARHLQRDLEVGNARDSMKALFTVKHIMERTVEEFKPKLESSNDIEEKSVADGC